MSSLTPGRQTRDATLIGCGFLVLACLLYWPVQPLDAHHLVFCVCSDPVQESWFLRWVPFAAGHGHDPFFTSYVHVPYGANLAVNTSMPLLALLGWPVTAMLGPIATYNLLLRVGIALSGLAMYLVMRRYVRSRGAAFAAALLFAFSPFIIGHADGHLFLVFLPLVPVLVTLADDWLVTPKRSAVVCGALFGATAALQFLISPEVLMMTGLGIAVAIGYLAATHVHRVRHQLRRAAVGAVSAVSAFLAIAGYSTYELLAGPLRPAGPIHPLRDWSYFHADLLSLVLPTRNVLLAPKALLAPDNSLVVGHGAEPGMYLGVPLLLAIVIIVVRLRRHPLVQVLAVTAAVGFLLALGPRLTVDGHTALTAFVYRPLESVPLLQDVEPDRLSLLVAFSIAFLVAIGVDSVVAAAPSDQRVPRLPGMARSALTLAVVLAVALPLLPRGLASRPVHVSQLFTRDRSLIPDGARTLAYPLGAPANRGLLWQAVGAMRFRIFGGEMYVPGPGGKTDLSSTAPLPPDLAAVFAGRIFAPGPGRTTALAEELRSFCREWHVQVVLVDSSFKPSGARLATQLVAAALAAPPTTVGGIQAWLDVPADLSR